MASNPKSILDPAKLTIEQLQTKYRELDRQKTASEANLKTAEDALAELRAKAKAEWGTDDLEELEQKLEKLKADNEAKRAEYQKHLSDIETELRRIEQEYSQPPAR
jgi:phage shock protein A